MTNSVHGEGFILVSRGSLVALVMKLGVFKCRNGAQAKSIVKEAMDLGIPVDLEMRFNGDYRCFISRDGVKALREKHGWKAPNPRKNSRRIKPRKIVSTFKRGVDYIRF